MQYNKGKDHPGQFKVMLNGYAFVEQILRKKIKYYRIGMNMFPDPDERPLVSKKFAYCCIAVLRR